MARRVLPKPPAAVRRLVSWAAPPAPSWRTRWILRRRSARPTNRAPMLCSATPEGNEQTMPRSDCGCGSLDSSRKAADNFWASCATRLSRIGGGRFAEGQDQVGCRGVATSESQAHFETAEAALGVCLRGEDHYDRGIEDSVE